MPNSANQPTSANQTTKNSQAANTPTGSQAEYQTDYLVIGAGVVGLAIAKALSDAGKQCLVVEKQARFGEETSSRNSEVIHAGIYYPQGSLKARLCVQGKQQLYQYCQERHIAHSALGKLIVATAPCEEDQLDIIQQKAQNNGVDDLQLISESRFHTLEPRIKATAALFSPSTGIVDAHQLMLSMVGDIEDAGNAIVYKAEVIEIEATHPGWRVTINNQGERLTLACRWLINAAGLHANALASHYMEDAPKLHFCRGLYFSYPGTHLFKHLIYPVPEKNTVGLGIHATLDMAGQVKFGPDTHYQSHIDYQMPSADELANIKAHWVSAIQRYFPTLEPEKLQPGYAGIRPKLSGPGEAAQDFRIEGPESHDRDNLIQLFGIESPGLTSSLAIGQYVLQLIQEFDG
jgi:L-2-hydroxyglutarate oxidase LhgO